MALVALALRLGLMLWLHSYEFPAAWGHFAFGMETGSIAGSLSTGQGFSSPFGKPTGPTAWVGPVYPYLCAGVFRLFGVFSPTSGFVMLFLNSVFAALTCLTIVQIGERTVGRRAGLWAGWLWAAAPFFMQWAVAWVWDMSLSALLLSLLFLLALDLRRTTGWRMWLRFGLLWGLAALTNPSLLSFLPFSLAWAAWHLHRERQPWLRAVTVAILGCVVVVTPWLIRNRLVFGETVFIRSNFWFEFHLGNYHLSNGLGWRGKHPTVNPQEFEEYRRLGELGYVARAREQALEFLRQSPGEFVELSLKRFRYFWDGTPVLYSRAEVKVWQPWMVLTFSLLAGFGLLLAFGRWVNAAALFALLLLSYPALYYLTYANIRYRHAIEPELLLLAVYFLHQLATDFRARLRL